MGIFLKRALLTTTLGCLGFIQVKAQNLDFENGLTGWTCETGCAPNVAAYPTYGGDPMAGPNVAGANCNGGWVVSGPVAGRHSVIAPSGNPYCQPNFTLTPPGGGGTGILKLGNEQVYSYAERVSNTFAITESNCLITIRYLVMLQDGPGQHNSTDAAFFRMEFFDQANAPLSCPSPVLINYNNSAAALPTAPGYNWVPANGGAPCWGYRSTGWQTATFDMSGYVGQNVTLRFTTADCAIGGDAAIAYIDGSMAPLVPTAKPIACFGGSTNITASSGSNYNWLTTGVTTQTYTANTVGTYTVTYTNTSSCPRRELYTVTIPPDINVTASLGQNVTCNAGTNGSASASASGGTPSLSYSWSNGTLGASLNNVASTTYTVTITDGNSCTKTATVFIDQPTAIDVAANLGSNVSCNGKTDGSATSTVSGGVTNYTYSWSNNTNGTSISNVPAGTYVLTITDANSCTKTSSVIISEPNALVATASNGNSISCFGGNDGTANVNVSGGTTSYNYSWSNGQNGTQATGLYADTTYFVVVTDANGCTTTSNTVVLTQPKALDATTSVSSSISCFGASDASVTANGVDGTAPYTYSWVSFSPAQNTATATGLATGTYTVHITDSKLCTTTKTINVNQPSAVALQIVSVNSPTCYNGSTGSAQIHASGGTPVYSFNWSPSGGTDSIANNLPKGNYLVTVTDSRGCKKDTTITINDPQPFVLNAGTTTPVSCYGGSNGSASTSASGSNGGPYSYSWTTSVGTSVGTNDTIQNVTSGDYYVTVTDNMGCTTSQSVTITQPQAPLTISSLNTTNLTCDGKNDGQIKSTVTGGTTNYTYSWSNNEITADISNLPTGQYTLTVVDKNGCTTTSSTTITAPPALLGAIANPATVCGGDSTSISVSTSGGSGNYSYSWSDGYTGSGQHTVTIDSTKIYTVTISDGCSSPWTGTVAVNINPKPNADFGVNPIEAFTDENINFNDSSLYGNSWRWILGDGTEAGTQNTQHSYSITGTIPVTLIVTSDKGCKDTLTKDVLIKEKLIIPNIFSPNGDTENPMFVISTSGATEYHIEIYDRWGLKMFESNNAKSHWDGKAPSGNNAPDGTYYYLLRVRFYSGRNVEQPGVITLVR